MSDSYADYLDFFRRGPYAPYLKEHRLAGSSPVRLLRIVQPAGHYPDPATPDLTLQVAVRPTSVERVDVGAGVWWGRLGRGSVCLAPPDTAADYALATAHEFLVAAVPMAALRPVLEEASPGFTDFGGLHAAPFRDPLVEALCQRLWDEAARGSPLGSLFADSAVRTLALALLRRAGVAGAEPEPARGVPLASWRLRRCLDYMGDNLAEDIGLAELAAAAGLSPSHFARAFKLATGSPPHRHLIGMRVERAKEALLAAPEMPLAEVALACGFAGQSHMGEAFRRLVGTSPGVYRRGE